MTKFKKGDVVADYSKLTPITDKEHPEYTKGTLFVLLGQKEGLMRGEVVELATQDGSRCPFFNNGHCISWYKLAELPITSNSKENKPMGRRTFKLVKAMPGIKVGTLFQEECEDGTQPYSPVKNPAQYDNSLEIRFHDRKLVEESPFFVEVFKVEPEYMTREQLDACQAFLGQKKRGRPVGSKTKKAAPTTKAKMAASWTPERRKAQARRMRKLHKQRKLGAK